MKIEQRKETLRTQIRNYVVNCRALGLTIEKSHILLLANDLKVNRDTAMTMLFLINNSK
jgi:uncharacterized protein YacL (UPF0231 family)